MTDRPHDAARGSRNRPLLIAGGAVVLAGIVIAGVVAASGTGPARANLPAPATTAQAPGGTASQARAAQPPAAPRPALKGKGDPIRISGTDPVTRRRVTLDRFTGKPVVLAIWASWCPGCNDEAPHLSKVAAARADVHFIGLNYRDDPGGAKRFYAKYDWSFPSIEDASGDIAFRLGMQGTPTTLLLDSEHREIGRIVGPTDLAGFTEAVDRITAS